MWHQMYFVAESRRLDTTSLTAFAFAHQDRYGIVVMYGQPEVSTWHVDALVRDFTAQTSVVNQG